MEEKVCIKCKISKLLSEFQLRPDSLDGHRNSCFACEEARRIAARERAAIAQQTSTVKEKLCYKCNTNKPIMDFSKRSDSPDGRRDYCKKCEFGKVKGARPAGLNTRLVDLPDGTRICSQCKTPKPLVDFRKMKTCRFGRAGECKDCALIRATALANKYRASGIVCKEGSKICYCCKKEKPFEEFGINRRVKDGRNSGCLECRKETGAIFRQANLELVREQARKSVNKRRQGVNHRLKESLRAVNRGILKKGQKAGSGVRDLGCSIEEFMKYIESLWTPGMCWDNHSQWSWVLDHIIPLDSFDLTNREQFLSACNYKNLQPMWWQDNIAKGSKMPWDFTQPLSSGPAPRPRDRLKGREAAKETIAIINQSTQSY